MKNHMIFWFSEFAAVVVFEGLAYMTRIGNRNFYRWDEMAWWNWYPDADQTNVVAQLGDFASM